AAARRCRARATARSAATAATTTATTATTATAAGVTDENVVRSLDQLALAAAMFRRVVFAERRLAVDEHGGAALLRLPHVGAAADGVNAHVVDAQRRPAVDEHVG